VGEVGGLEGTAEDGNGVVLGGDIVERFGAAASVVSMNVARECCGGGRSYYFSTHGCSLFFSGCVGVLEELAFAAASFWRALMSKKLAMVCVCGGDIDCLISRSMHAGNFQRDIKRVKCSSCLSMRQAEADLQDSKTEPNSSRHQGLSCMNTSTLLTRSSTFICS